MLWSDQPWRTLKKMLSVRDRRAWISWIGGEQYANWIFLCVLHDVIPVYSVAHLEKIGSLADWKESALTEEVQTLLDEYFPEPPPNKNL